MKGAELQRYLPSSIADSFQELFFGCRKQAGLPVSGRVSVYRHFFPQFKTEVGEICQLTQALRTGLLGYTLPLSHWKLTLPIDSAVSSQGVG
jgi:hypothetical protein